MLTGTNLYKEIHEQPEILRRLLGAERDKVAELAAELKKRDVAHVMIAARGTSDNAARYAKYLLAAANGLMVSLATPSLFTIYRQPPRFRDALVLGVSQSGQSPDIVAVLAEGRRQGALTAAITDFPASDLAGQADYVIELHAGVERSLAATKTYTAELAAIALLSATLAGEAEMLESLQSIPEALASTLAMDEWIAEVVQRYRYMREGVVIGRGYNYATAYEIALKLKELTYTTIEAYSSADFLHGPLALIEHGFPALTVAVSGAMLAEMQRFMHTLREREAEIVAISDDPRTLELADIPLALPARVPEWLSPLVAVVPGQLFAMHLAAIRRYDPDQPRGLIKVTRTR